MSEKPKSADQKGLHSEILSALTTTIGSLQKQTRTLCAILLLSTGCNTLPVWNKIPAEEALSEFRDEEGDNRILSAAPFIENTLSEESQNDESPSPTEPSTDLPRFLIPDQWRDYRVTEDYFRQQPITAELMRTRILLRSNKEDLLREIGPYAFYANLLEDTQIITPEQNQILQTWLLELSQEVHTEHERLQEMSREQKIDYVITDQREQLPICFPNPQTPDVTDFVLTPSSEWGLRIPISRTELECDVQESLHMLDDESLDTVLFFTTINRILNEREINYSSGAHDLRSIMTMDEPRFDCNTIATLRTCLAIENHLSDRLSYHVGLSRVSEQRAGHASLRVQLSTQEGTSWDWFLDSGLIIPSRSLSELIDTNHTITYQWEKITGDVPMLLAGFYENVLYNFRLSSRPLLYFWQGQVIRTAVNSRQAALAADLFLNGCVTGPERENMIAVGSVLIPVLLRDRSWGPQLHRLAPEQCQIIQEMNFDHTAFNLYEIPE